MRVWQLYSLVRICNSLTTLSSDNGRSQSVEEFFSVLEIVFVIVWCSRATGHIEKSRDLENFVMNEATQILPSSEKLNRTTVQTEARCKQNTPSDIRQKIWNTVSCYPWLYSSYSDLPQSSKKTKDIQRLGSSNTDNVQMKSLGEFLRKTYNTIRHLIFWTWGIARFD